jgi:signal transduction histidine kinase
LLRWAEKWRWLILAFIGLSLLWVEVQEFLVLRILDQPFHYFEVFQYAVLLISTGTLIELYARSNRAHKQALNILRHKHRLSLEFTANEEWELLIAKVVELPGKITSVDESFLLVSNPISHRFEIVSHRVENGHHSESPAWDPTVPCQTCREQTSAKKINFHLCRDPNEGIPYHAYSLSILDQDQNYAVLKFRLTPGRQLSREEEELFTSIGDEIAVSLRASQNRKRVTELKYAQVAIAERRLVSAYVHDQLGQNLGFLHLKLDQLGNHQAVKKSKDLGSELKRLQGVANESYEIVRDILKKMQPETIPHLGNVLREYARKVSRRADFALNFQAQGSPVNLSAEAQQIIFYIFFEVLNNIEKHAGASNVDVLVEWNEDCLGLSISDNGAGFDSQAAGHANHFGLQILRERIAKLNGQLTINSSVNSGTAISISIPFDQNKEAPQ